MINNPTLAVSKGLTSDRLYLELLKRCLTRILFPDLYAPIKPQRTSLLGRVLWTFYLLAEKALERWDCRLVRIVLYEDEDRIYGRQWPPPPEAETMIGLRRLDHLETCIRTIQSENVPGDLIETGVWRGGATIFMRAVLEAIADSSRTIWVADSFEGLPRPRLPQDEGDILHTVSEFVVPLDTVQANFRRYGLLDDRVRFVKGWFRESLFRADFGAFSLIRLDGDMYESTINALTALYPRLSVGGYVIVDDYNLPGCRLAVEDFRSANSISDPLSPIDWAAVYWRRT